MNLKNYLYRLQLHLNLRKTSTMHSLINQKLKKIIAIQKFHNILIYGNMYLKCKNDEHLVLDREYLENLPSCFSKIGFLLKNQTLIFDLVKFD